MSKPSEVPQAVLAAHEGWTFEFVQAPYDYEVWRLHRGDEIRYLKVGSVGEYPGLRAESERIRWLNGRLPVPEVVMNGTDDEREWMATTTMAGLTAYDERMRSDPATVVPIFGRGLRAFHAAPIDNCPFDFTLDVALEHVHGRVTAVPCRIDTSEFHPEFAHLTARDILSILETERPETEDLVLCHGDYCFPNVLIEEGKVTGYIDLGEFGVADRWLDLAVGTWTCDWNVGPGWQDLFLESYGIERDEERIRYYRFLYELAS